MKIEIGESLIFSWLRHVRGCPIVQTSWKPSPTWPVRHEGSLAADFEKMREIAAQRLGVIATMEGDETDPPSPKRRQRAPEAESPELR